MSVSMQKRLGTSLLLAALISGLGGCEERDAAQVAIGRAEVQIRDASALPQGEDRQAAAFAEVAAELERAAAAADQEVAAAEALRIAAEAEAARGLVLAANAVDEAVRLSETAIEAERRLGELTNLAALHGLVAVFSPADQRQFLDARSSELAGRRAELEAVQAQLAQELAELNAQIEATRQQALTARQLEIDLRLIASKQNPIERAETIAQAAVHQRTANEFSREQALLELDAEQVRLAIEDIEADIARVDAAIATIEAARQRLGEKDRKLTEQAAQLATRVEKSRQALREALDQMSARYNEQVAPGFQQALQSLRAAAATARQARGDGGLAARITQARIDHAMVAVLQRHIAAIITMQAVAEQVAQAPAAGDGYAPLVEMLAQKRQELEAALQAAAAQAATSMAAAAGREQTLRDIAARLEQRASDAEAAGGETGDMPAAEDTSEEPPATPAEEEVAPPADDVEDIAQPEAPAEVPDEPAAGPDDEETAADDEALPDAEEPAEGEDVPDETA